jgi:alpha-D-ribose 1-methylphosphonate 5-triphosphate synthase subunit PhnG
MQEGDRNRAPPQSGGNAAPEIAARRAAMAILAEARPDELARGLAGLGAQPESTPLRAPETGLVMLRGRIGGDGAAFNLGEATVTRTAIQLGSGEIGLAYVLGRDPEKARLAALCDALWQNPDYRGRIEGEVLAPIKSRLEGERALERAQTAATRVDFFTLVRGEDAS